ncbi:GNAT family N-acetyltransferase [Bacillus amyloliquefaciens]|uniref:GNAT family N-acetyltransferase n=1 Tax=Bacillus amyloliquefaciens TaxID=1390 RepID=UPI000826F35D|nr:GNAT family N-acetyltransferase [Bacillus amyloliquefaciens]AOC90888.1 uncharacterized protein BARD7_01418 [Bacillus amyloliquefaciens]
MLTDREFEEEDIGFLEQLAAAHPVWKAEEFGTKNAAEFMLAYSMYNGTWLVWELDGTPAAVSFHLEWAPSNGKPWLGTVAVAPEAKEKGTGRAVIEEIAGRLRAEHKAMFTAVPLARQEWVLFLSQCGFEQLKLEKDDREKTYMIMVKPL